MEGGTQTWSTVQDQGIRIRISNIIFKLDREFFHVNKWILGDRGTSILHRLCFFGKVLSTVACFGCSHRVIHKDYLAKLDVEHCRSRNLRLMLQNLPLEWWTRGFWNGTKEHGNAGDQPTLGKQRWQNITPGNILEYWIVKAAAYDHRMLLE